MSKTKKTVLFTAAGLIAAGVLLVGLALLLGGSDFSGLNTMRLEEKNVIIEETFIDIAVEDVDSGVFIALAEDGQSRVVSYDSEKMYHTVEVQNGTLCVRRIDHRSWYDYIGISLSQEQTVTVYLPRAEYESLLVTTVSGDINVEEGLSFQTAEFQNASGHIAFHGTATVLQAESTSGSLELSGLQGSAVEVKTTSGRITLADSTADSISAKTTSGRIAISLVQCRGALGAESTSGSIALERVEFASAVLETVSGSVGGTLCSSKRFSARSVSGKIDLPIDDPTAGECRVSTTSGNICLELAL